MTFSAQMRRRPLLLSGSLYAWAFPVTAVGLVLAALARVTGARAARVDGVIEVAGGILPRVFSAGKRTSRICAITLGHVVLSATERDLESARAHERVHVRQCERWGVAFPFAYVIASGIALVRGHDPYRGNAFEREAFDLAPVE